jgi:hypothetical protein
MAFMGLFTRVDRNWAKSMRNLKQLSQTTKDSLSRLVEQEATLNAELTVIQQEKEQMQAALDRIELIRSGEHDLGRYDCMYCFVLNGNTTEMKPTPSETDCLMLYCSGCERKFEFKP